MVDAAALGFDTVSLSGGEPLLYDGLDEILAAARQVGSRVNLVSNGILIRSPRYARHAGAFAVVALSLDGLRERHDAVRGSARSFDQVREAAALLRAAGQRFGLIHTLCAESLDEVEAVAALADEWGAALLQLHPFEAAGRAAGMRTLGEEQRLDAMLLAAILAEQYPRLRVQLDLVHREVARRLPAAIDAAPLDQPALPRVLVLQDDGMVVPLTYGIDSAWTVADLRRQSLATAWPAFLAATWPLLRRHLRRAAEALAAGHHGEVVDWHALLRRYAALPAWGEPHVAAAH